MKRLILIISAVIFILSGCAVKQGRLVVMNNENQNETQQDKSVYEHLNMESRNFPIEKYTEVVKK